jgi:chromosome partitioning protein
MARIIAIANHKGGTGKTTTTLNLAGYYASQGSRVLTCDLDPQASLTNTLGLAPETLPVTLADLLLGDELPADLIHRTPLAGVEVIPANSALASAEKQLMARMNRERLLARALPQIAPRFDYVLLDCPPALDLLNTNGLAAAHEVVIPLQSSILALQALPEFLKTVAIIQKEINPDLRIARIALTMHQPHTRHSQDVLRAVLEQFPELVFRSPIPLSVLAKDSAAARQSIFSYDPTSPVAEAYRRLAEELISHA